jgi:hypothetical protein
MSALEFANVDNVLERTLQGSKNEILTSKTVLTDWNDLSYKKQIMPCH